VTEATGRSANYGYDNIYRLLNETISSDATSANNGALAYALDPVGNRKSMASTLAALQAQTFTYVADDRISGDTFDSNGNTQTSSGVTYTYDFEDRLLTTSSGATIVYDGDGNRVSETASGATTQFLVDDQTPTGYAQVAEELVSGAVTAQFTYGPMRISQRRTATSFYGYDAGGSVHQLTDNTGTVTDTYAYDAFGNTVAQTGSTVNEFKYRGEQYDASLQMYYLRARYYRPQTGRFLSQDKWEEADSIPCPCGAKVPFLTPGGLNHLFEYAHADPANFIDPSGNANIMEFLLSSFGISRSVLLLGSAEASGAGGQLWAAGRIVTFIFCKVYTIERTAVWAGSGFHFMHFPSFVPYSNSLPPYFPKWAKQD
jgi:RHS repeat-associated protein